MALFLLTIYLFMFHTMNMNNEFSFFEKIIESFIYTHPEAWSAFMVEQGKSRKNLHDQKYGQSRGTTSSGANPRLRFSASFPNDPYGNNMLDQFIKIEPDLMKNKDKWNRFLKKFPVFVVAENN